MMNVSIMMWINARSISVTVELLGSDRLNLVLKFVDEWQK